ncbi:MAG: dockerin type I repeat-containing protein [Candidatus Zixiibacteriota bacterium]|nr:MAG: dockerin type I repeat-containing protein [candidate division Zixibacteria bacterium]
MRCCLAAGTLILCAGVVFGQGGVTLDHVEGTIEEGGTVVFHMRLNNDGDPVHRMLNGYRITSNGLTWGAIEGTMNPAYPWDLVSGYPCFFDLGMSVAVFPPDLIGFSGEVGLWGTGLPPGFDDIGYTITVGPISLNNGSCLTLDSSFYPIAGYWLWQIEGGIAVNCDWDGPHNIGYCSLITWLSQDPIYLKELEDRLVYVYFRPPDVNDVDLCSVRIQDKIKTYSQECAWIEGDLIVTDVLAFRLIAPWRPISGTFNTTYTVSWDTYSGHHYVLYGDLNVELYPGDVNLDGEVNAGDLIFMSDYLFSDGLPSQLEEVMDIDQNGRVDALDMAALSRLVGF